MRLFVNRQWQKLVVHRSASHLIYPLVNYSVWREFTSMNNHTGGGKKNRLQVI